jgi:CheY-like chemotaxis protein
MSQPSDTVQRIGELLHDLVPELDLIRERADAGLDVAREARVPETELRMIRRTAEEAAGILRDTLDYLAGRRGTPEQRFAPAEATVDLVNAITPSLGRCEIALEIDVPANAGIAGLSSWYRRALANLVRNAVAHAERVVRVNLRAGDGPEGRAGFVLAVEDDGPGWGGASGGAGYGIGLESVRWATERLGGVMTKGAGEVLGGARVELWFPRAGRVRRRKHTTNRLEGLRVTVVDDDEALRIIIPQALEAHGARVTPLAPPLTAEDIIRSEPDVLLLDLHLGVTAGETLWLVLQHLHPPTAERTIFLTGALDPTLTPAAARQPLLTKPFGLAELVDRIAYYIDRSPAPPH